MEILPDVDCWSVPAELCAGPRLPGRMLHLSPGLRPPGSAKDSDSERADWPPVDHCFRALTHQPYWSLKQRDCRWLMLHIFARLMLLYGNHPALSKLPRHPLHFSFSAARLAIPDPAALQELLEMDSVWKRLHWTHRWLGAHDVVVCRDCGSVLARLQNAITMLKTFVNPHGVNHDVVTVSELELVEGRSSAFLVGRTSSEATWFPGFAWTIAVCRHCNNHIGWRFTAEPEFISERSEFWGLSRRGIRVAEDK